MGKHGRAYPRVPRHCSNKGQDGLDLAGIQVQVKGSTASLGDSDGQGGQARSKNRRTRKMLHHTVRNLIVCGDAAFGRGGQSGEMKGTG